MARKKRIWIPGQYYHIVNRGNRRDPLFRSASDFEAFLHILDQLHEKYPFEIASYCLMTNHYHLQLRSQNISISKIMSLINKRYANYYNTRYRLSGHVFEKRFHDSIIVDKKGMLEVSAYIHLNPVEAKMVQQPEHYPWSSYYLFKYPQSAIPLFMNVDSVLNLFTLEKEKRAQRYCDFVMERRSKKSLDEWNFCRK